MTWMPNQQFLDLARSAAKAAAPSNTVGDFIEVVDEGDDTFTYLFASKQKGYLGWRWSVTIYQGLDQPTVSEVLLMPGPDSLIAPNWVPWSERLADWKALQAELERQAAEEAEDDLPDDDEDDAVDEDEDDLDPEEADQAHELSDESLEHDSSTTVSDASNVNDSVEAVDADAEDDGLSVTDLKPSEDPEGNTRKARKRIPSFIRRKLRGGKGEDAN